MQACTRDTGQVYTTSPLLGLMSCVLEQDVSINTCMCRHAVNGTGREHVVRLDRPSERLPGGPVTGNADA